MSLIFNEKLAFAFYDYSFSQDFVLQIAIPEEDLRNPVKIL